MLNKFFITGLPRTRSAWFSVFFSAFPVRCFHDGIMGCESVGEYFDKLEGGDYSVTGDAGSGIPFFWKQIADRYENPPIVVIERDMAPILEFGRETGTTEGIETLQRTIEDMDEKYHVLKVKFEDIDARLPEIWRFCVGGYAFDHHRADLYKQMNIQRDLGRYTDPVNLEKLKKVMETI